MEWFPHLSVGWLNGWTMCLVQFIVQGTAIIISPEPVLKRLFDRSGWQVRQRLFFRAGKLFSLVCLFLIIFAPLKTGSSVFYIGLVIFTVGLVGIVVALKNYKDTPLDQPVTRGLYRISRHPQVVAAVVAILGICVAVGSWAAVLALLASHLLQHFGILAEEAVCLQQYGESYRTYLKRMPRYFLFF
jgi:protein-S-isoprenylcysteine O-methyltransferase Ste14